jgi:NADPH-dependent ferric siderophore reductase
VPASPAIRHADFAQAFFNGLRRLMITSNDRARRRRNQERRDYTPRRYADNVLVLDFAVHEAGPANRWALEARPGDMVKVAGPEGSTIISPEVQSWLLIGDGTALPPIGRGIEEAEEDAQIVAVVAVDGVAEEQRLATRANLTMVWVHRSLVAPEIRRPCCMPSRD